MENDNVQNVGEQNADAFESPVEKVKITNIVCPHCGGSIIIEKKVHARRGQLDGIELKDMNDEQLKREIINAKSVLYKAEKRGAAPELIAKNQERVDLAVAEKEKRGPSQVVKAATDNSITVKAGDSAGVYKEGEDNKLASEI